MKTIEDARAYIAEDKHGRLWGVVREELEINLDALFAEELERYVLQWWQEVRGAFDDQGDFVLRGFDPYRRYTEEHMQQYPEQREFGEKSIKIFDALFTDRGSLREAAQLWLTSIINENKWDWGCDAVRCYYAQEHGSNTKDAYPASYMWR